jgi:hypothetical protein
MLAGQLALIAAALFTGAAIYINAAEQPARLDLGDKALFTEWRSAYKRGFAHAGTVGPRRVSPRSIGVVADERVALACRRYCLCCQLAVYALCRRADELGKSRPSTRLVQARRAGC